MLHIQLALSFPLHSHGSQPLLWDSSHTSFLQAVPSLWPRCCPLCTCGDGFLLPVCQQQGGHRQPRWDRFPCLSSSVQFRYRVVEKIQGMSNFLARLEGSIGPETCPACSPLTATKQWNMSSKAELFRVVGCKASKDSTEHCIVEFSIFYESRNLTFNIWLHLTLFLKCIS